jgi:DNA-binding NtrC family response regulator
MPDSSRPFRVLVVDDNSVIADSLAMILTTRGYDAFATYSAEQALEWCHDKRPDAVITDVVMGPMNGIQLAIRLAETMPECNVLLLSGNALTEYLLRNSNGGAYGFPLLAKPAHPNEILHFLAAIQTDVHP